MLFMTNILDQFQNNSRAFRPATAKQYMAMQLARRAGRLDQVRVYAALLERYPLDVVLQALRKTLQGRQVFSLDLLEKEIEHRIGKDQQWQI